MSQPVRPPHGTAHLRRAIRDEFAPCGHQAWGEKQLCDSPRRIARAQLREDGTAERVGFLCEREHKLKWETGGLWIPLDVFSPDGDYPDMFPSSVIPVRSKRRKVTFDIKDNMAYQHRSAKACAACDSPPATSLNRAQLGTWLSNHGSDFFDRKLRKPILAYFADKPKYDDGWYMVLDATLRAEIQKEVNDSRMTADHGIPRAILEEIRDELSSDERRLLVASSPFRCVYGATEVVTTSSIVSTCLPYAREGLHFRQR